MKNTIWNTKKVIAPKELDIWIPSIRTAIEFNGLEWHSEARSKDSLRDFKKHLICSSRGIRLIQIFSDENWKQILDQHLLNCPVPNSNEFLSDNRFGNDEYYTSLGYIPIEGISPKFMWCTPFRRSDTPGEEGKWFRIYDSGKKRWHKLDSPRESC